MVTGGAGFIGSHLVERLLQNGNDVVVVDNLSSGQLKNLPAHDRLTVHRVDITNAAHLTEAFEGADWVFHLAAVADIVPSIENPDLYHRVNVDGTFNVLEAARAAQVKRFVYAASSSCYGIPDNFPTPESAPFNAMYPYALTKYIGEQYVLHWGRTYGLPIASLRLFNVFGPRHRTSGAYGAVFGVFLAQKLAGKPFTIVGDGSQTRDFTFVTDVADAFIATAASDVSGEVMNVGSGGTYSVKQLVELLDGPAVHIPKRPGEPDCTFADISKIGRLVGWSPRIDFETGVAEILRHIDDWRDAPIWTVDRIAEATAGWFKYLSQVPR